MRLRTTHTLALLEVPREMHEHITKVLREAGYEHCFDGETIDMTGIGLVIGPATAPEEDSSNG